MSEDGIWRTIRGTRVSTKDLVPTGSSNGEVWVPGWKVEDRRPAGGD